MSSQELIDVVRFEIKKGATWMLHKKRQLNRLSCVDAWGDKRSSG